MKSTFLGWLQNVFPSPPYGYQYEPRREKQASRNPYRHALFPEDVKPCYNADNYAELPEGDDIAGLFGQLVRPEDKGV